MQAINAPGYAELLIPADHEINYTVIMRIFNALLESVATIEKKAATKPAEN